MSENQMMVMPEKELKDLKTKKQDEILKLQGHPITGLMTYTRVKIDILEKQIEVIDVFIKKRGIT